MTMLDFKNTWNNARCTQATHGLDAWIASIRGQDSRGRVNQNDRKQINGESTSMVWPTVKSRTAKEQNRT